MTGRPATLFSLLEQMSGGIPDEELGAVARRGERLSVNVHVEPLLRFSCPLFFSGLVACRI